MRRPPDGQSGKVTQRQVGAPSVEGADCQLPPEYCRDFQVGEFGQHHTLAAQPSARLVAVGPVVGEGDDQDAGVSDEHGRR